MPRQNVNDLLAFRVVAQERSFTRAAAQLGVSPSALSHALRALEERLGLRLLTRTTRSVVPTVAGERLLGAIGPLFDGIDTELAALNELRDKPAGLIRITTGIHPAETRSPACPAPFAARLSGHTGRARRAGGLYRHRRRTVRRRRAPGRDYRAGHGGGADRPRHAHGGRGLTRPISPPTKRPPRRRIWHGINASICAFPRMEASTPGSLNTAVARSMCGSRDS